MCGRKAQTQGAVVTAASTLMSTSNAGSVVDRICPRGSPEIASDNHDATPQNGNYPWRDNFNLSPGHDAVVFTLNKTTGKMEMTRKIWGLVTKSGTTSNPIPKGPSKHFANLMFNARSDTLFSKPTFARLLGEGNSCVVALDGFFEWKVDALGGGKGKKQPYFVFRKDSVNSVDSKERKPLLLAGLWTTVATGWGDNQSTLDTFTVLTTKVCDPLKWLHSRMPVLIWENELALHWLKDPSRKVHQQLDMGAHRTKDDCLSWHAVSTQMSSTKYRYADSIKALPKQKSVQSFFAPAVKKRDVIQGPSTSSDSGRAGKPKSTDNNNDESITSGFEASKKRLMPLPNKHSPTRKSPKKAKNATNTLIKKGAITAFFSQRSSTS